MNSFIQNSSQHNSVNRAGNGEFMLPPVFMTMR